MNTTTVQPPKISRLIIHCAATPNGDPLSGDKYHGLTAPQIIDRWHAARGFVRAPAACKAFNPNLPYIGYHFVIDCDGVVYTGRAVTEQGAHTLGFNRDSIGISLGICMTGTSAYTGIQWDALEDLIRELQNRYSLPDARIVGHRDLSPDTNGDGLIQPWEWLKTCPGFVVADWLARGMRPLETQICDHLDVDYKGIP
jgi:N-acetylmuramoyl-L-alanine amidase